MWLKFWETTTLYRNCHQICNTIQKDMIIFSCNFHFNVFFFSLHFHLSVSFSSCTFIFSSLCTFIFFPHALFWLFYLVNLVIIYNTLFFSFSRWFLTTSLFETFNYFHFNRCHFCQIFNVINIYDSLKTVVKWLF